MMCLNVQTGVCVAAGGKKHSYHLFTGVSLPDSKSVKVVHVTVNVCLYRNKPIKFATTYFIYVSHSTEISRFS